MKPRRPRRCGRFQRRMQSTRASIALDTRASLPTWARWGVAVPRWGPIARICSIRSFPELIPLRPPPSRAGISSRTMLLSPLPLFRIRTRPLQRSRCRPRSIRPERNRTAWITAGICGQIRPGQLRLRYLRVAPVGHRPLFFFQPARDFVFNWNGPCPQRQRIPYPITLWKRVRFG